MKSKIFFLILVLLSVSLLPRASGVDEYGENSTALGQFVDDYENETWVSVKNEVVNNQTLDVMELNQTDQNIRIKEFENGTAQGAFQYREHRIWGGTQVYNYQSVIANAFREALTASSAYRCAGWFYITVHKDWLDGKYLRWYWYKWGSGFSGGSAYTFPRLRVYDGEYNRTSFTDFPVGGNPPEKGSGGLVYQIWQIGNVNAWYLREQLLDLSSCNQTYVTLMWAEYDYHTSLKLGIYMDYIQINTGSGGSGNLWTCDFESASHNLFLELTGTGDDYGIINQTRGYYEGGYKDSGYFNTTNLMSEVNGSGLVVLLNSSIPAQSEMTVQFSEDGENFTDHEGAPGYVEVIDGFQSIDIRDIYPSSELELRFNLSKPTQVNVTPRLYQTRLISTEDGAGAPGNGTVTVTTVESDAPWIALAIILSLISALLFTRKR